MDIMHLINIIIFNIVAPARISAKVGPMGEPNGERNYYEK